MKCQILFSRKNKKNISEGCLLKFLLSMQSIKNLTFICPALSGASLSFFFFPSAFTGLPFAFGPP